MDVAPPNKSVRCILPGRVKERAQITSDMVFVFLRGSVFMPVLQTNVNIGPQCCFFSVKHTCFRSLNTTGGTVT